MRFLDPRGIPVPRLIDSGDELAACHWLVATKLRGGAADTVFPALSPHRREDLAYSLGALLGKMHSMRPVDSLKLPRMAASENAQAALKADRHRPTDAHEVFNAALKVLTAGPSNRIQRPIVLVHGDFSLRNVMVTLPAEGTAQIEGIIDFERAFLGDPMEDLATLIRRDFWPDPVLIKAVLGGSGSAELGRELIEFELLQETVLVQLLEIMAWSALDDPAFYQRTKQIADEILFADAWSSLELSIFR